MENCIPLGKERSSRVADTLSQRGDIAMELLAAPSGTRTLARPLSDLLAFEHERLIKRYIKDFGVPAETARLRFTGFKQFIAVCGLMDGHKVTSDTIDSVWHTFLLFTRDYADFCRDYLGRFIHHEPFENPNPGAYVATRSYAEKLYGPLDETLWPLNAKGDCSSGCCRD